MDRVRHVWVREEHGPRQFEGLVLEWRRASPDGDWEALVQYVLHRGGAVTEWVAADRLRPVR